MVNCCLTNVGRFLAFIFIFNLCKCLMRSLSKQLLWIYDSCITNSYSASYFTNLIHIPIQLKWCQMKFINYWMSNSGFRIRQSVCIAVANKILSGIWILRFALPIIIVMLMTKSHLISFRFGIQIVEIC